MKITKSIIKEILALEQLSQIDYTLLEYYVLIGLLNQSKARLFKRALGKYLRREIT